MSLNSLLPIAAVVGVGALAWFALGKPTSIDALKSGFENILTPSAKANFGFHGGFHGGFHPGGGGGFHPGFRGGFHRYPGYFPPIPYGYPGYMPPAYPPAYPYPGVPGPWYNNPWDRRLRGPGFPHRIDWDDHRRHGFDYGAYGFQHPDYDRDHNYGIPHPVDHDHDFHPHPHPEAGHFFGVPGAPEHHIGGGSDYHGENIAGAPGEDDAAGNIGS